jgi:hypothetical protein
VLLSRALGGIFNVPIEERSSGLSSIAWVLAASDLHIDVTAPYTIRGCHGDTIEFVARVRDFGTKAGTLVWYMPDTLPTRQLPTTPFFVSVLNPNIYFDYDRQRFIDLLEAWGWTGKGPPPAWYTER